MVEKIALELQDTLAGEIEVIEQFTRNERIIKTLIEENDWEKLKNSLEEMKPLAERMEEWEEARNRLFCCLRNEIGEKDTAGFYQVIVHLPPELRDSLSSVYRRLKSAVIRLQGITYSIDAYVRAVTGTMNQILNEMYPHRKGNIYTSNGAPMESELNPLLLNHRL